MKFTFKNLGPIKSAEMRLGQLTVIAGENNVGKTYLVYALYGFLQMIEGFSDVSLSLRADSKNPLNQILGKMARYTNTDAIRHRSESLIEKLPIPKVEASVNAVMLHLSKAFSQKGVSEVFSSRKHFRNFSFNCGDAKLIWPAGHEETINWREFKEWGFTRFAPPIFRNAHIRRAGDALIVKTDNAIYASQDANAVAMGLVVGMLLGNISTPFILSTERFGISLFYKELDFAKNRLVEMLQKMPNKGRTYNAPVLIRASSAHYAQPIKDNIDYTRELGETQKEIARMGEGKLFDGIKNMMGGYYKRDDYETHFISKARKKGAFRIPLHLASSSARGLSDFYFYLKHTAYPGQLLIVDEPETHLHPVNQIQVARLLARCANAGLRVLITTHSDYIVKELNNLIMLSQDFKGKSAFLSKHKKHYDENDYLKKSDVCAYVCENGGLTECEIDSRGMIMDSFNDPILEIDRISKELDARLPEEE